jgi:hypothetical protein
LIGFLIPALQIEEEFRCHNVNYSKDERAPELKIEVFLKKNCTENNHHMKITKFHSFTWSHGFKPCVQILYNGA